MWVAQGDIQEHLTGIAYRYSLPNRSSPQISEEQAIRGTEEHLRQAVHRQLVSDVPVGAFLSGGLDSSSVVAFARECARSSLLHQMCVVLVMRDLVMISHARRVAAHLGLPLDVVQVDAGRMAAGLEKMVGNLMNRWLILLP